MAIEVNQEMRTNFQEKNVQPLTNSAKILARQVERSEFRMARYRATSNQMIRAWCGPYYGNGNSVGTSPADPVNTLMTIGSIVLPNIVGTNVLCKVTPRNKKELRYFAKRLELRINQSLKEMRFGHRMKRGAVQSLFSCGLFKTSIEAKPLRTDFEDWQQDPGVPFVDPISVDDWVFDPDCKFLPAAHWQGHMYMIRYDDALESGNYDNVELAKIRNEYRQVIADMRAAGISKSDPYFGDEYLSYVRLCEIYLRKEGVIVTIPGNPSSTTKYLNEKPYTGPESGMYNDLGYHYPPDNPMAVPPMAHVMDMHNAINTVVRKVRRRAEAAKSFILASMAAGEKDVKAVRDVNDGEVLQLAADVNNFKQVDLGGNSRDTYDSLAQLREIQNWVAGNPEAVGGLKAEAKTLGQDEMQLQQANIRLWEMNNQVRYCQKEILKKVAWHIWEDRTTDSELEMTLPSGTKIYLDWMANHREGTFDDYNMEIVPYVPQSDNPVQQYTRTMQLIQTVVLPLAPLAAQLGVHIDVPALVESMGDKLDLPDLWKWFQTKAPIENPAPVNPGASQSSPSSRSGGGRVTGGPTNPAAQGPQGQPSGPPRSAKPVGEAVGV